MGVVGVALGAAGQQRRRREEEMSILHQPGQQIAHAAAESQRSAIPLPFKVPIGPGRAAIPAKTSLPATPRGFRKRSSFGTSLTAGQGGQFQHAENRRPSESKTMPAAALQNGADRGQERIQLSHRSQNTTLHQSMQPTTTYSVAYPNQGQDQQQMSSRSIAHDFEQPSNRAVEEDMESRQQVAHESAKPPASPGRQMVRALKTAEQALLPGHDYFEADSKEAGRHRFTGGERASEGQHRALIATQEDIADPSEEQSSSLERKESGLYFCLVGLTNTNNTNTERGNRTNDGADLEQLADSLLQRSTEPKEAATFSTQRPGVNALSDAQPLSRMGRLLSTTHELTPTDPSGKHATTLQPNKVVVVHSNCRSSRQAARRMKEAV